MQEDVPAGVAIASIKDAVATLQCGREWEAKLTLVPAPPAPPAPHAETQSEVTFMPLTSHSGPCFASALCHTAVHP